MFDPINTQEDFEMMIRPRLRRERAKIRRKDAEALQPIIDNLDRMRDDLIALRDSWKESQGKDS